MAPQQHHTTTSMNGHKRKVKEFFHFLISNNLCVCVCEDERKAVAEHEIEAANYHKNSRSNSNVSDKDMNASHRRMEAIYIQLPTTTTHTRDSV